MMERSVAAKVWTHNSSAQPCTFNELALDEKKIDGPGLPGGSYFCITPLKSESDRAEFKITKIDLCSVLAENLIFTLYFRKIIFY